MSAMRVLRFASAARAGSGIEAVPLATDEVRVDVRAPSRSAVFRNGQHVSAVERVFTRHNPLVSKSGRLSTAAAALETGEVDFWGVGGPYTRACNASSSRASTCAHGSPAALARSTGVPTWSQLIPRH